MNRSRRVILAFAVAMFGMALLAPVAQATPRTFSGPDGPIVFSSDQSGNPGGLELYSINPDGSGLTQLTHSPKHTTNSYPDWSPDGRYIAFSSDRSHPGGQNEIWVMRADGSNPRRLTSGGPTGENDLDPAFSPDGQQIAFDRCFSDGCAVWIMNADGSGQQALTEHTINGNFSPQFSPDGSQIAFTRHPHGPPVYKSAVFAMAPDGTGAHRITPWSLQAGLADWSPDGVRILFVSNAVVPHSSLFSIRQDGTGLTQLTNPPSNHNDFYPSYAPLQDRIAFISDRTGYPDLWIANADGSPLHDVTNTPGFLELWPDWGPGRP